MRKECIFTLKNSYRDDLNIIREDDLTSVKTDMPGIFSRHVEPGEEEPGRGAGFHYGPDGRRGDQSDPGTDRWYRIFCTQYAAGNGRNGYFQDYSQITPVK